MVRNLVVRIALLIVTSLTLVAQQEGVEIAWTSIDSIGLSTSWFDPLITLDAEENVYAISAISNDREGTSYLLVKYASDGTRLWSTGYDGPENSYNVTDIACDANGNLYMAASSFNWTAEPWSSCSIVKKYSSNGTLNWVMNYDGAWASDLALDLDGNVYVTGGSDIISGAICTTIKYSSEGVEQWVARLDSSYSSSGRSIIVDSDGNVFVVGATGGWESSDFFTLKYNSDGSFAWEARYHGPGNGRDYAKSIALDNDGNIFVGGCSGSFTDRDFATIKYSPEGNELWVARYNHSQHDYVKGIAVDMNGCAIVSGSVESGTTTIKYGPDGEELWLIYNDSLSHLNGPESEGELGHWGPVLDTEGNIYITGNYPSEATGMDLATIKYAADGSVIWSQSYNSPDDYDDIGYNVALAEDGSVYVTGGTGMTGYAGSWTEVDLLTVKLSQPQLTSMDGNISIPAGFDLHQNYPNPFNPNTTISYELPEQTTVSLTVYDVRGQEVLTLQESVQSPGRYEVQWNGLNRSGNPVSTGVYFARLDAGEFSQTIKMLMIK
ncbi:MAG: SBBP repeat-containing protein [Candidatus Marinimicrobia bacterium]|nr:SBBP repeat-containing protein [Candidatus Neomarinimicrobiota bacterium]